MESAEEIGKLKKKIEELRIRPFRWLRRRLEFEDKSEKCYEGALPPTGHEEMKYGQNTCAQQVPLRDLPPTL